MIRRNLSTKSELLLFLKEERVSKHVTVLSEKEK